MLREVCRNGSKSAIVTSKSVVNTASGYVTAIRGALQIQDRSPQLRSVASEYVCDWLRDETGLDCGDRSWICNAPQFFTSIYFSFVLLAVVTFCATIIIINVTKVLFADSKFLILVLYGTRVSPYFQPSNGAPLEILWY